MARGQVAGKHHVDLGAVDSDLNSDVDPGDQAKYRREHPVRGVAVQVVVDQVSADDLQHRPQDAAGDRAREQLPDRDTLRGQYPEGGDIHTHVD